MKRVIFDIETDGLLEDMTRVHCLVLRDRDSGEVVSCTDSGPGYAPIKRGLQILSEAEIIYAHNGIAFDIPALQKLYPGWTHPEVFDTLVAVRHVWAHIKEQDYHRARRHGFPAKLIGNQGLKAWGYRMGILKGAFNNEDTDWSTWTPEMQRYCERDTEVTGALLERIEAMKPRQNPLKTDMAAAWYLAQQERNGWPFDFEAAVRLQATLAARREELADVLRAHFGSWQVSKGMFTPKRDNKKMGYVAGVPVERFKTVDFNPASRQHIANRLITLHGWKPIEKTPTGHPKVDETTLKGLPYPMTDVLVEYLTVEKRLGQLAEGKQAWLALMTDTSPEGGALTGLHHIHHGAMATTITHRHRHAGPNIAQVPKALPSVPYGVECRSLFTVPKGWVLLGSDASGLELRCLAHYMARWDGGEYGKVILEGDIHSTNRDALGLEGKQGRDQSKTFIYAYLYGAGNGKLGIIMHPLYEEEEQKQVGKGYRRRFEKRIPALGSLVETVKEKAKTTGWLRLIDGRRAFVRHQHAALNTLLQGTGAVICKTWLVEIDRRLRARFGGPPGGGWKHQWAALAWVHDEVQIAVREEIAEEAATIVVEAIRAMTQRFDFRIPLDGEAVIGRTWADTH